MTYFDSAEELTKSKQRTLQEFATHGVTASDTNVFLTRWVISPSIMLRMY